MSGILLDAKNSLNDLASRPFFKAPESMYKQAEDAVGDLERRIDLAYTNSLTRKKEEITRYAERLQGLNPYGVLKRGYSITQKADGTLIKSTKDVKAGDTLESHLEDGIITSKVQ
jgi:exodeoxyribonuclease VII large subunit